MTTLQSFPEMPSPEPRLGWGVIYSSILHLILVIVLMDLAGFSSPKKTYFSSSYRVKLVDAPVSKRGKEAITKAERKQQGKERTIKAPKKKLKQAETKKRLSLSKKSSIPKKGVTQKLKGKPRARDTEKAFSLTLNKIKGRVEERRRKEEIARIRDKIIEEEEKADGGLKAGSGGMPPGQGIIANLPLNYRLYYQTIEQNIKNNWNLALPRGVIEEMRGMEVIMSITIRSDGEIIKTSFEKKSGNLYLDDSAFRAIKKSSPLPPFSEYNIRESSFETGIIFPAGELL